MKDTNRIPSPSSGTPAEANIPFVIPVRDRIPPPPRRMEDIPCVIPVKQADPHLVLPIDKPAPPLVLPIDDEVSDLQMVGRILIAPFERVLGITTLIVGLAVLAAIPVVQFLALGYLLEAGARIARTGKLRHGFIGVRTAGRIGGIILAGFVLLLPLFVVASLAADAELVDPGGPVAGAWRVGAIALAIPLVLHIGLACARGGKLRHFAWPFNFIWLLRQLWHGGFYRRTRDAFWDFLVALQLPYYFWLGLRGFAGALLWLALPVSLLALGSRAGPLTSMLHADIRNPKSALFLSDFAYGIGFTLFMGGAFLLAIVLLYLPFLQMHFAVENRFRAFFDLGEVRQRYRRAPWMFAFAFFITLLFALPLYLLKIEMVPHQAGWLVSLFFIVFIFPARFLTGWAYARSLRREEPRHWFFRWTGRLSQLPILVVYVLILLITPYAAWEGIWSLYAQHAFLLPVPFMSM